MKRIFENYIHTIMAEYVKMMDSNINYYNNMFISIEKKRENIDNHTRRLIPSIIATLGYTMTQEEYKAIIIYMDYYKTRQICQQYIQNYKVSQHDSEMGHRIAYKHRVNLVINLEKYILKSTGQLKIK